MEQHHNPPFWYYYDFGPLTPGTYYHGNNYIQVVESLPARLIEENAAAGVTKLALLAKLNPDDREDLTGETLANIKAVASIISKNRENFKVTPETVLEWMDQDQLAAFMAAYAAWLKKEKDTNPN